MIWYYYLNKKTLDLKKTMREQQSVARRRALNRKVAEPLPPGMPRELRGLGIQNTFWGNAPVSPNLTYEPRRRSVVNYDEEPVESTPTSAPSPVTTTTNNSNSGNNNNNNNNSNKAASRPTMLGNGYVFLQINSNY